MNVSFRHCSTTSTIIGQSIVFLTLLLIVLTGIADAQTASRSVTVVTFKESAVYSQAISGLNAALKAVPAGVKISMIEFQGTNTIKSINQTKPSVIVTLGTTVTKQIAESIKDIPIVFTAVLGPVKEGLEAPNVTGSLLNIPVKKQFETFKSIVPDIKTIGVLYNPVINETLIQEATVTARTMGLSLDSQPVKDYKNFIPQISTWLAKIDAFWFIADDVICQSANIKHLLLQLVTNKKPAMGISPAFAQTGALFALTCDYEDVGRQAGEIVCRILNGDNPQDIPPTEARKTKIYLNMTSAKSLDLTIPLDVVKEAAEVF